MSAAVNLSAHAKPPLLSELIRESMDDVDWSATERAST